MCVCVYVIPRAESEKDFKCLSYCCLLGIRGKILILSQLVPYMTLDTFFNLSQELFFLIWK